LGVWLACAGYRVSGLRYPNPYPLEPRAQTPNPNLKPETLTQVVVATTMKRGKGLVQVHPVERDRGGGREREREGEQARERESEREMARESAKPSREFFPRISQPKPGGYLTRIPCHTVEYDPSIRSQRTSRNLRALCGANLVTEPPNAWGNEPLEFHRAGNPLYGKALVQVYLTPQVQVLRTPQVQVYPTPPRRTLQ